MPKSILVVDDSTKSLTALAQALESAGYDSLVLQASDDPVVQFGLLKPELVFLSLRDGKSLALCEGIRDNPDGAIVPVIFVGTGSEAVRSPSDALTQGGDYYFQEPLDLTKVLAKVQTYVGVGTAPVELEAPAPSNALAPPPGHAPFATSLGGSAPAGNPNDRPTLRGIPALADEPTPLAPATMNAEPTHVPGSAPATAPPKLPGLPEFSWDGATTSTTDEGAMTAAADDLLKAIQAKEAESPARPAALSDEPRGNADDETPPEEPPTDEASDEEAARLKEEEELQAKLEAQRQADEAAMRRADDEARERAEEEIRKLAEEEAQERAQEEAARKALEEAARKAEEEAARKAEEEARRRIEEEARRKAEEETRRRAEEEAQREAEEEARRRIEEEARHKAEETARKKAEEDARRRAEEEARRQAEEEIRRKLEEETRRQAEKEAREQAEEELRRKAEEETRRKVEEEIRKRTEEAIRRKTEEEIRRRAEEEARRKLEEEARRKAEEELRRKAEEDLRRKAEEELRRKAEEEARHKAEEELRRKAEEEARAEAEMRKQVEAEVRRKLARPEKAAQAAPPEERAEKKPAKTSEAKVAPRRERLPVDEAPAPPTPVAWDEPAVAVKHPRPSGLAPLAALQPAEGTFAGAQDIAWLLHELWRQQVTGRVDFASDNRQKSLFMERGGPVDAYSSQVFDRMEEFLYREGKITRAQYQDVRVKALRNPRKIGAYLVSEGYMKPEELFASVRGYLMQVVFGLFEWESGTFKYLPERVEEDDRITLDVDPRALVSEGIRRKFLLPRLMRQIGAPSSLLVPKSDVELDADALGLSAEERQVVRLLDGTRSIEDLVFSTGLSAQRVYQVLATVTTVGYAEVRVRGIEGVGEDGASVGDDIDRRRIVEKVEQVRKLDYFQILGVPQAGTAYEIDRAYDRALADFKSERFSEAVRRELGEELLEIARVLDDAREVLKNDALKEAYARHLS